MFTIDVRTRRKDTGPGQMIVGNHSAQRFKPLVPLAGIAECGDTMNQLSQREFRIVLDMEMQVDEAWHDRASRQVDRFSLRRHVNLCPRANVNNLIAFDDDASMFNRRLAAAVNDTRVIEDDEP